MKILRSQAGLSLVELLVTMIIFVLVIVAASNIFIGILGQYKQQSKIAETSIEGLVGLQMLRSDIEQAGYGLPYDIGTADYNEAVNDGTTTQDDTSFNDAGVTDAPPRAVLTGTVTGGISGLPNTYASDVLVLKATNIAMNDTVKKWASVSNTGPTNVIATWTNTVTGGSLTEENLCYNSVAPCNGADNVTVLRPAVGLRQRVLMTDAGPPVAFYRTFPNPAAVSTVDPFFPTVESYETYIMYGLTPNGTAPRMPFNRADYYVKRPATMPTHCAPQTGVLYKATLNHGDGLHTEYPLLDCVAAMKVVLMADTDEDAVTPLVPVTAGAWLPAPTAANIRNQLKEVRVYIIAHEGQEDPSFTYSAQGPDVALGIDHLGVWDPDVSTTVPLLNYTVPDRNYRWKVYTMVLKPYNLR